jgi:hypothetical protein
MYMRSQDVAKCEEFGKLFGTGATNASVSASAAANANTSSSTGVLGFFGRLFGFGSTASTSEHLPVAPNTALPGQQQQRRMPLLLSPFGLNSDNSGNVYKPPSFSRRLCNMARALGYERTFC